MRDDMDLTGWDGRGDAAGAPPDKAADPERSPMPHLPDAFGTIMEILAFKARRGAAVIALPACLGPAAPARERERGREVTRR